MFLYKSCLTQEGIYYNVVYCLLPDIKSWRSIITNPHTDTQLPCGIYSRWTPLYQQLCMGNNWSYDNSFFRIFSFLFFPSYLLNLKIIRPPNTLILPFLNIQWASYLVFGTEWARRFTQLMLSLIFWRKKKSSNPSICCVISLLYLLFA